MKNSEKEQKEMEQLERTIGYTFHNKKLLKQALTHSSYANEKSWESWDATNVWNS